MASGGFCLLGRGWGQGKVRRQRGIEEASYLSLNPTPWRSLGVSENSLVGGGKDGVSRWAAFPGDL